MHGRGHFLRRVGRGRRWELRSGLGSKRKAHRGPQVVVYVSFDQTGDFWLVNFDPGDVVIGNTISATMDFFLLEGKSMLG